MDADGLAFYNIVPVNQTVARNRVVDKKLILVPIELNEVRKSPFDGSESGISTLMRIEKFSHMKYHYPYLLPASWHLV